MGSLGDSICKGVEVGLLEVGDEEWRIGKAPIGDFLTGPKESSEVAS